MSGFAINGVYPEGVRNETPYIPEDFAAAFPDDPEKQRAAADAKNQAMAQEKTSKSKGGLINATKGLFKRGDTSSTGGHGQDAEQGGVEQIAVRADEHKK